MQKSAHADSHKFKVGDKLGTVGTVKWPKKSPTVLVELL